ncbi:hypothetical protein HOT75_gp095 [Gordonia phage Daredevil]|uniref:Uncharacterized protein n=1 Tax=Gordonia phage Daredevil TaxID=2283286 RepID=A0A345MIV1_9CAUD|nr:hypothetical protein HOT75_gp095 [Gordonia phage Daredevil]AXH70482.1 hypothetical protein SEA_DAREDEVIL_95 [Gordonia phage Daredevil]
MTGWIAFAILAPLSATLLLLLVVTIADRDRIDDDLRTEIHSRMNYEQRSNIAEGKLASVDKVLKTAHGDLIHRSALQMALGRKELR